VKLLRAVRGGFAPRSRYDAGASDVLVVRVLAGTPPADARHESRRAR
jgi:hypothetical protein